MWRKSERGTSPGSNEMPKAPSAAQSPTCAVRPNGILPKRSARRHRANKCRTGSISKIKNSSGDARAGEADGETVARTSSGSIVVKLAKGKVVARNSGGKIEVNEARDVVMAHTSSGPILVGLGLQPQTDSQLEVSGGDISVALPRGMAIDLDAESSGGKVISAIPITMTVSGLLAQVGYRVVLIDLRGHGQSTGPTISYGKFETADLKQVLNHTARHRVGALKVGVVGIGYGANLALHWAARDPKGWHRGRHWSIQSAGASIRADGRRTQVIHFSRSASRRPGGCRSTAGYQVGRLVGRGSIAPDQEAGPARRGISVPEPPW